MLHYFILWFLKLYKFCIRVTLRRFSDLMILKGVKLKFREFGIRLGDKKKQPDLKPWDIDVHDPRFYRRVAVDHALGLGETYMEGWWDCDDILELWYRFYKAGPWIPFSARLVDWLGFVPINRQSEELSKEVAIKHYDLGNQLFSYMLDKNMCYSCGYWANADNLDQAQLDKMDLIARKLKLEPGMKVLDLGCGWGGMAKFLAEKYKVSVVGYNISKEQVAYARKLCADLPVEIRMEDYRKVNEKFDRIYHIGFFEHVGRKNYRKFFELTNRCLKDDGLHLVHTIAVIDKRIITTEEWTNTYIFPGGQLPYGADLDEYSQGYFIIEDLHNFGDDYHRTLLAWHKNFNDNWPKLRNLYGEKFYRMWNYYLLHCAATFKARKLHLLQAVMSKNGVAVHDDLWKDLQDMSVGYRFLIRFRVGSALLCLYVKPLFLLTFADNGTLIKTFSFTVKSSVTGKFAVAAIPRPLALSSSSNKRIGSLLTSLTPFSLT
ncbi:unnamed protein product, partial [Cyprideis torosa]